MGWKHFRSGVTGQVSFLSPGSYDSEHTKELMGLGVLQECPNGDEANAPDFSGDIALAFRVVEKLSDRFWMRLQTPFWKRASHRAIFTKYRCTGSDERLSDVWSDGATAAEAICRAALATLVEIAPEGVE